MEAYEVALLFDGKINLSNNNFSQRELEILAFLCNGRSHKFIASTLGLSVRTVEAHARNIVIKSGLASIERVINSLTFSGDINVLNSVYTYKMYEKEFEKFIANFHADENVVILCDDDVDHNILVKIKEIFERVGYKNVTETGDKSVKHVLIQNNKNSDIILDGLYTLNLDSGCLYLSVLECLKALSGDLAIDIEIQRFHSVVAPGVNKTREDLNGNKKGRIWREKMNKGGFLGIATSACGALALAGGLYGFYPRQNEMITITNQETFANNFFFERTKLVNTILDNLAAKDRINVVVLVGPGGAGKTALAENIMRKELENYSLTYKINTENEEDLSRSFAELADRLATTKQLREMLLGIESDNKIGRRKQKIVAFLKEQLKKQKRWLLVFDNVEDINLLSTVCPTQGNGNVIITTRDQNINYNPMFENKKIINVGELAENEKVDLFNAVLARINSSTHYENDDIKRLMASIPSYPLDVTTVACCLAGLNIPIDEYINTMNIEANGFENVDELLMYNSTSYGKTRYGIIVSTLNQILKEVNDSVDVKSALLAISICESQDIPLAILKRYKDLSLQKDVLTLLRKYSFITENDGCVSIHRVVQDMWRKILCKKMSSDELKNFLDGFLSNVVSFEDVTYEYRTFKNYTFPRNFYASMNGHLQRFVSLLNTLPLDKDDKARYMARALAIKSAVSINYGGNYKEIARDLKRVLEINEKYHIYSEYDRVILLNLLWSAEDKFDAESAKSIMLNISDMLRYLGEEALPMKIRFKLGACTEAMMNGDQQLGNQLLREGFEMLPKNDDYWVRLLNTELKLFITDFEVQNHLNNNKLASSTADLFSQLLAQLNASDLKSSIDLAKKDMMPRLVAALMAERIWTYNLAERYKEADAAYNDYVAYLGAYPIAKYELRAQTYNSTTLLRLNELEKAKKMAFTTYTQWKLADSQGMVYETLADLTEACVRLGEYEEALKYAAENPGDCGMQGIVQAFADARSFFNYGIAAMKLDKSTEALAFFNKSLEKTRIVAKSCLNEDQFSSLGESLFATKNDVFIAFRAVKVAFNAIFDPENKFLVNYVNRISEFNQDSLLDKMKRQVYDTVHGWLE